MATQARRGTFAFDLSKPQKKGILLKQGQRHKAFKHRLFVLYPGFLVYYEDETKWRFDLTKGETLGGRLGAIKLKNSKVAIARDTPKGCKFGLAVHAPDPANKRKYYLVNASSKEERDSWIEAIRQAIPRTKTSPSQPKKELPKNKVKELPLPHPKYTPRQDTANAAAILAAEHEIEKETSIDSHVPVPEEQAETSIDSHLLVPEAQTEPSITIRHNTADVAAFLSSEGTGESEETEEQVTSIDDELVNQLLGPGGGYASSDEGPTPEPEEVFSPKPPTPEPEEVVSPKPPTPEPEEVVSPKPPTPEPEEVVSPKPPTPEPEEVVSPKPPTPEPEEVISPKPPTPEPEEAVSPKPPTPEPEEAVSPKPPTPEPEEVVSLKPPTPEPEEVVSPTPLETDETVESSVNEKGTVEVVTSVTVVANGEGADSPDIKVDSEPPPRKESSGSDVEMKSSEVSFTRQEDVGTVATVTIAMGDSDTTSSDEEDELENDVESEEFTILPAITVPPVITVEKADTLRKEGTPLANGTANGTANGSANGSALIPKHNPARRGSTPFIEKRGFLYKMGGQRKNWKLRYFVLQAGGFSYYKKDPRSKPLGEVKLKNLQIFFPAVGERKQSFQFTVHTESSWNKRPNWVVAAQSEREMKEWIIAFKSAGGEKSPTASPTNSDSEGETKASNNS